MTVVAAALAKAIERSTAAIASWLPSVARRMWLKRGVFMLQGSTHGGSDDRVEGPTLQRPGGVDSPAMNQRRDRKDVLLEAGLTLAAELSLPIVLQRIVDLAAQVTDARYGALGVIGDAGTLVEFVTTGISAKDRRAIGPLPTGRGVLGLLIHEPKPVRITNIGEHPLSVGFPPSHPPMRSFLGAPVQAMGRVFGNIYLAEKRNAIEFSQDADESLIVLATQAGVAIANASLYDEVRSREQWLNALRDTTTRALGGEEELPSLESIAEHARQVAAAEAATIVSV